MRPTVENIIKKRFFRERLFREKLEIFLQCEIVSMETPEEAVTLQRKRDGEKVIEDGYIYCHLDFRFRIKVSSEVLQV